MAADPPPRSASRRTYIDWARGLAVLIMVEAHVLDAWTLRAQRDTAAFGWFNLLGGIAAPLFLWLAGVSLVLAAEQRAVRFGSRAAAGGSLLKRGALIFALAFLFRLQAFVVSPGNPLVSLLRVDILNIMGPAMMVAALLWRAAGGRRAAAVALGVVAAGIALATPLVRNAPWLGSLPALVQWYLSPNGNHSTFTLFPWAGFLFAGGVVGSALAATDVTRDRKAIGWIAGAGLVLMAVSYLASLRPSIYADSSFWHTSPTYFGLRTGLMMVVLGGLFALAGTAEYAPAPFAVLATLGRHSLFVYWIHVELVYGYATIYLHHRLPLPAVLVAYLLFCTALYWAITLKNRFLRWRMAKPGRAGTAEALRA